MMVAARASPLAATSAMPVSVSLKSSSTKWASAAANPAGAAASGAAAAGTAGAGADSGAGFAGSVAGTAAAVGADGSVVAACASIGAARVAPRTAVGASALITIACAADPLNAIADTNRTATRRSGRRRIASFPAGQTWKAAAYHRLPIVRSLYEGARQRHDAPPHFLVTLL